MKAKQEEMQAKITKLLKTKTNLVEKPPAIAPSLQKAIDSLIKSGPNLLSATMSGTASRLTGGAGSSNSSVLNNYYSNIVGGGGGGDMGGPPQGMYPPGGHSNYGGY